MASCVSTIRPKHLTDVPVDDAGTATLSDTLIEGPELLVSQLPPGRHRAQAEAWGKVATTSLLTLSTVR